MAPITLLGPAAANSEAAALRAPAAAKWVTTNEPTTWEKTLHRRVQCVM